MIELLYSWTRQMPQVGGVVLPLDLTDAMYLLSELLFSLTRHMSQVGEVALPLDLIDAQVGSRAALLIDSTDATGR